VIKTGLLPPKYARYLSKLSAYRETADYNVLTFISSEDADESIKMAEEFLKEIKKIIKNKF